MAKIQWAGQSCFQISVSNSRDHSADIVIDPFDEETGLKAPNFSADIALVTHGHHDHNNIKALKPARSATQGVAGGGEPFIIDGPGEYEVKGVFVQGIPSFHDNIEGKERGQNTIYLIEAEDIKICHLGDLGQKQLTDEQLEKIDSVDVLMIPVGGEYTIDSQEAQKIISQIEPLVVIPMHYALPKLSSKIKLDSVDKFLKTMGKPSVTSVDKFTVKASTLPKEGMEIVVLAP
ncbi:MAG: MBL fold metallo-hydrolase [Candidatus Staskawiczbacteria bacterium]|nr:MBL fold metallo-hydrolase [Candidatus Staskawiczbacteria bacterium]